MKEIPLTKGYVALVDDEDYERVNAIKWHAQVQRTGAVYAAATINRKKVYMHRVITGASKHLLVDHRNFDTLNNTRSNLRVCSKPENSWNRGKQKNNTTGYCGVTRHGSGFRATTWVNGVHVNIGTYRTPERAATAYDMATIVYHGEFAKLNYPRERYEVYCNV